MPDKTPEEKAEAKAKKKLNNLRKITISRRTMQISIPAHVRDKALKAVGRTTENVRERRSLTTWNPKENAMVTRIVELK